MQPAAFASETPPTPLNIKRINNSNHGLTGSKIGAFVVNRIKQLHEQDTTDTTSFNVYKKLLQKLIDLDTRSIDDPERNCQTLEKCIDDNDALTVLEKDMFREWETSADKSDIYTVSETMHEFILKQHKQALEKVELLAQARDNEIAQLLQARDNEIVKLNKQLNEANKHMLNSILQVSRGLSDGNDGSDVEDD